MKIIRIEKCAECPKMLKNWRNGDPYCGASERMIWLTDTSLVHELCPLEDSKQESDNE